MIYTSEQIGEIRVVEGNPDFGHLNRQGIG